MLCVESCDSSDVNCLATCGRVVAECIDSCPCHTDCINGCNGCQNQICFCQVRLTVYLWIIFKIRLRNQKGMKTYWPVSMRIASNSDNVFMFAEMTHSVGINANRISIQIILIVRVR